MGLKARQLSRFRYWDRICSTWEAYLRWETEGFPSETRALPSVSACTKKIKLLFFYLKQTTHVGTNEHRLNPFRTAVPFWVQTTQIRSSLSPKRDCGSERVNRQTCPGIQSDPTLILTRLRLVSAETESLEQCSEAMSSFF